MFEWSNIGGVGGWFIIQAELRLLKRKQEDYDRVFRNNQAYYDRKMLETQSFRFGAEHTKVRRMKQQDILHKKTINLARYEEKKRKIAIKRASLYQEWFDVTTKKIIQ